MARSTGRARRFDVQTRHPRQELMGARMESIREFGPSDGGLASNDPHEGGNHAAVIKIVLNVGGEYQNSELLIDCEKSMSDCDNRFRCASANPSNNKPTKKLEGSQHKTTLTKAVCGRHQHKRCADNQQIPQLSSVGLLNYEQQSSSILRSVSNGISSEIHCDTSPACCESCTENVACCSNHTTRAACLMRPPTVFITSNRLAAARGQQPGSEATLTGRQLEQAINDGACTCCPTRLFGSSRAEQVAGSNYLFNAVNNHDTPCFCCGHNRTSDLFTNSVLVEKDDCSPANSVDGSLLFKEQQAISRSPYVTTINLTSKNYQKQTEESCQASSFSSSPVEASKDELKKSYNLSDDIPQKASGLVKGGRANQTENNSSDKWYQSTVRYNKMSHKPGDGFWWRISHSCFCNLAKTSLLSLFPILSAFENYSLPGDLLNDLMAGLTIAVLQIPQGMAYGLLSGVEPIYGLYVSFVPVLIMALMSKSRHVSYGTFAMISILLANAIESVKLIFKQRLDLQAALVKPITVDNGTGLSSLVVTDNHQPVDPSQQLLKNLILSQPSTFNTPSSDGNGHSNLTTVESAIAFIWPILDPASFAMPTNIEILTTVCLLVGIIQVAMALFRLGIVSLMFSEQFVSAFTVASALHVITSQLGPVLDLDLPSIPDRIFKICYIWWTFVMKISEDLNHHTALLTLCSILFLLLIKELIEPALRRHCKIFINLHSELILMCFLIFASWYWKFKEEFNIRVIGDFPSGLPEPKLPRLDIAPLVVYDAITVALISFALNVSLVKTFAKRFNYTTNANQELLALGTSNIVASFFSCFPCASSISRSSVQSNLNVKSPLCSLFSCLMVLSIICYFAPILHDLPRSTLSCIIIVALKGVLIQAKDLYENWLSSKLDAFVWLITFSSVFALGITYGLVVGITASTFILLLRSCNRVAVQ